MKTHDEIKRIADREANHEDTVWDIEEAKTINRHSLWKSAFKLGYEMGQLGVEKWEDMR